jgi:hypothetical protein
MKKRFTEEQIVYALKQSESGVRVADLIRTMSTASRRSIAGRSSLRALE